MPHASPSSSDVLLWLYKALLIFLTYSYHLPSSGESPSLTNFRFPRESCLLLSLFKLFPLWQCISKNHNSSSFKRETKTKDKLWVLYVEKHGQQIWAAHPTILVTLGLCLLPINPWCTAILPRMHQNKNPCIITYSNPDLFWATIHIIKYLKSFLKFYFIIIKLYNQVTECLGKKEELSMFSLLYKMITIITMS